MNPRRRQEGSSRALFFLHVSARSQHLGWSCEQQGLLLLEESSGVRGFRGTGEDRELLVLGMCACVIGLLYTCTSLVCHKIVTEQMPSSSPRGLVQVLSMVLLSALSSEYFLTWLLNMPWAGTWQGAALAPKVLVLFQTKCHCAWLRSACEEGEAEHWGGGARHPSSDTAPQTSSPAERSKWGGWEGGAQSWRPLAPAGVLAGLPCASRSAPCERRSCCSYRDLHSLWSRSCCQQGPVWDPRGWESQPGFCTA